MRGLELVGVMGIILYGFLLLVTCIRIFVVSGGKEFLDIKVIFHYLLALNATVELIYFIEFYVHDKFTLFGYTCHMLGMFYNITAFATVIYVWGSTIAYKEDFEESKQFGVCIILINGLATLYAIAILAYQGNYDLFTEKNFGSLLLLAMVNSLTLFLLSAGLFIYGWKLKTKLLSNSIWTPSEKARKVEVLMRINTVLGICCMCFLLRVICLIGVIIDDIREVSLTDQVTQLVWFTISNFIPTLCPAVVLLVVMRRTKKETERVKHESNTHNAFANSYRDSEYEVEDEGVDAEGGGRGRGSASAEVFASIRLSRGKLGRVIDMVETDADEPINPMRFYSEDGEEPTLSKQEFRMNSTLSMDSSVGDYPFYANHIHDNT